MKCKLLAAGLIAGALACGSAALAAPEQKQPKPGPVEKAAEQQILEVRDAIVDGLWLKTDEYWHSQQNLERVVEICREVIELDPKFAEAYSVAAWLSVQSDKEEQALEFYKQGIEYNPDSYTLLHELGFEYYMMHKHDPRAALPYLKRAAELPSPIPFKRTYAHALTQAGKFPEAAAEWRKILKQDPNDPIARKELAKLRAAGKEPKAP